MDSNPDTVIIFKNYGMGITAPADQPLREKLAGTFLRLLIESGRLPRAICFYTDGVKLACEGSPILDPLKELESRGVRLILCKTCLDTFNLIDQVRVGIVGGMGDIIEAMWQADKVIEV